MNAKDTLDTFGLVVASNLLLMFLYVWCPL
jgi:hypothetical protein